MLLTIILHEIRHHFLSLRYQLALLITFIVFGCGTVASLKNFETRMEEYEKYETELRENLKNTAEVNISRLAMKRQDFIFKPRKNEFITGSKEKYLPNNITFSAFNVFGFESRKGTTNPYLNLFDELNWGFIVAIILSFTVFLFTYDSISGEKEAHTLAASLSNSLSRGTLLFGKYIATIITILSILLPSICVSLIILLISGNVTVTAATLMEILGFIAVSILFLSCITACGLFSSVLVKNSEVSLLAALILWMMFVVIIPNSATFLSQTLYPIDNADTVQEKINSAKEIVESNGAEGRWFSVNNNPFHPLHEVRANHRMDLLNTEMQIRNEYYRDMFDQLEHARRLTFLSPVSLFDYLCEADVGGGYLRFQQVWNGLKAFQVQFLAFFKEKDAQDPDSPHWYNPNEDIATSKRPVNFEEVPIFEESSISFGNRFMYAGLYIMVMVIYTAVFFMMSFMLFAKYDVR